MRQREQQPRPMRPEQDDGLGMVEVIVSMFVLTVAVLAMAQGIALALNSLGTSTQRQQATAEVTAVLEQARSLDHATVAMRTGDAVIPVSGDYDPDSAGPLATEPIVASATGAVTGAPYQAQNGPRRIRTYVTQFTDPTLPAAGDDALRVTVVATYGTGQEVRQSTLVAEAQRGLPTPAYSVSSETVALSAPAPAPALGSPVCANHVITNNGIPDKYDILLPTAPLGYTVTAYHDLNGNGLGDVGEQLTDGSGDGRPDTVAPLDTDASLSLLVCYSGTAATPVATYELIVEVRSLYDSAVAETLTHELTIGNGLFLFLHDLDNTQSHDRVANAILPMNPTRPIQPTLFDYDANLDPNDLPGLYLPRGGQTVRWRYQFPAARTIGDTAVLRVWAAPPTALTGGALPPTLSLSVVVDHRRTNGTQQANLSVETYHSLPVPETGGWTEYEIQVSLPPTTSFSAEEFLQLTLGCHSTSASDCHVAYDTTGFTSFLMVQSP